MPALLPLSAQSNSISWLHICVLPLKERQEFYGAEEPFVSVYENSISVREPYFMLSKRHHWDESCLGEIGLFNQASARVGKMLSYLLSDSLIWKGHYCVQPLFIHSCDPSSANGFIEQSFFTTDMPESHSPGLCQTRFYSSFTCRLCYNIHWNTNRFSYCKGCMPRRSRVCELW